MHEGLPPDQIIKTGSPMYEVLHRFLPSVQDSPILKELGLEERKFLLFQHIEKKTLMTKITLQPFSGH